MEIIDDREGSDRLIYDTLVVGCDRFLSGWGEAEKGLSYAGWACKEDDAEKVLEWVQDRGDIKQPRIVDDDFTPPPGTAHFHIYVVRSGHAALK